MCVSPMETLIKYKTLEFHKIQFGICHLRFLNFHIRYIFIRLLTFTWLFHNFIEFCCFLSNLNMNQPSVQFSSVQLLSRVRLFATPWIAALQASLSITNSQSSLKLTSTELMMPSSHLILCRPLLLLHPIPPSIRVFSNESTLRMRWPKYWSFSCSSIPSVQENQLFAFHLFGPDRGTVQPNQ